MNLKLDPWVKTMKIIPCFKSYIDNPTMSELEFIYCPKCSTKLIEKEQEGMPRRLCPSCHYIQYINPLPGIAVLVESNDQLLLGKRSPESFLGGKWCLPCGFIEHNESYVEAGCREVFEETGLRVKITSLVNVSSNQLAPSVHTIVAVLMAEVVGGKLQAGDDLIEIMWVDPNDSLPEMAFESDKFIISKYNEKALIRIPIEVA